MSDEEQQDSEEMTVDAEHPWVDAAFAMSPMPTPSFVKVEPTKIEIAEGKTADAAMVTSIGANGVFTVFIPPAALYQLMQQSGAIFQMWEAEKANSPKLVVADKNMQREAQQVADLQAQAQKIIKG